MSRYHHSKSGLFLMELLFNLLLFCVLCGCGLMFFIKSNNLNDSTTSLHHAVSITSSIASIYESGDGSTASICNIYKNCDTDDDCIYIYFDKEYQPCSKEYSKYYAVVRKVDTTLDKVDICFYNSKDSMLYSIRACHFTPSTLDNHKEVTRP